MNKQNVKSIFIDGPISPAFIGASIAKHSSKAEIGGHSIFLGQVRNDVIDNKQVHAIEYTAYEDLCMDLIHNLREEMFEKHELCCLHIYHSLGKVKTGEICLFVFTSSEHRRDCIDACNEIVERLKKDLPVWGKELFTDASFQWKINKMR